MGHYHLLMQFETSADRQEVLRWLTTPEGIAGWWSDSVKGEAATTGDEFQLRFPTTDAVFELEVTAATADRVEWHIPDSPPWWKGTTIRFDLSDREDGGTSFLFSHRDFDPDNPVIPAITPAWVRFLDNLVAVAESGKANPAVRN